MSLTEIEYQHLKAKVLREHPVRKKLFAMTGLSGKLDDETFAELFLLIARRFEGVPEKIKEALVLIRSV